MAEQYEQVRSFLAAVRRRWFAQAFLSAVSRAAAAAAVPAFAALSVYWLVQPDGLLLVLLAGGAVLAALAAAALMAIRMDRRPSERQVARFVEERAAASPARVAFEDTLVTAVDSRATSDPAFGPLLVSAAIERLRGLTPADIVPSERIRRSALEAAAGVFALAVAIGFAVAPAGRAVEMAWLLFFPESIQVEVTPGSSRVVAGQPVTIRAVVRAGDRLLSRLTPSLTVSASGARRTVPMTPDGDGFAVPFESVDRTFRYTVAAGATSSNEFTITALFPPRVERIDLSYSYPAFTGLAPREEEDGGDIYAPAGTRVRVRVHADKPIASGRMSLEHGGAKPLAGAGTQVVEAELVLARDDSYRVTLSDADGLTTTGGTEYFIRLMADRPPDVRILRPAGDQRITPLEEVVIEARADDDHGISAFDLVYAVAGGRSRAIPFSKVTANGSARTGSHVLAAEELGVKPGDVITYYARARDVAGGKRPTETRSDMYFLEVRPFGEEFVAARSRAAGGGAASARIESLIAAQKEIISATWNIERRTGAGKSQKDIAAIALAQAELKARAEQMSASGGRGAGGLDFPRQIVPDGGRLPQPPPGSGVAGAIAAMNRAVDHLQAARTGDALAHEMAALQALLKVQAEIRRREVAMQQAGGGAGADSASEDLSALFDKELQRQQSTRYETRSSAEERQNRSGESALDRIRELARRQEELNQRQQQLDANLSAEERKRQLERLTREQEQLRQQVEEIAKRQSGQKGGAETQGRNGNALREASEQMRHAAGALGRNDAKTAAERSAEAAEQLRRAERSMTGNGPDARQRAAGEMRLEAQQIAEEQRRIASEAARLDKADPAASADARRRLAAEKEQLADRVDNLQRAATELAKQGSRDESGAGSQIRRAAGELEKGQIGRRMRETAAEMRENAGTAVAASEQQLARALDRVAEQLGGGSAETRALAGVLDQTRAIRDRLDGLERQIAQQEKNQNKTGEQQAELERLRQEYARELQQARGTLERLQRGMSPSGAGGTPEEHEWSPADPGTQPSKQDFSGWEALRKDINLALERTESAASARLARQAAADRLSAGGSERVPAEYERLIAQYYESLARRKK